MPSSIISPFPVFNDLDGSPLENGYIYIGQSNLNPETAPVNVFWDAARTIPAAQPIRTIGGFPSRNGSPSNVYVEADTYSITVRNSRRVFVYSAFDQSDAPSSVFDISTQVITATAGQTTFTLTTFTYLPGTDTLQVYRNGLRLTSVTDYVESNTSTVTLTAPAALGDEFLFQGGAVITGNQTPGTAVSFIQAGTGAVTRNMQDKARESVSVLDFGAVGNGAADDTAAVQAVTASNNQIYFPSGNYKLTTSVTPETKDFKADLDAGVQFTGSVLDFQYAMPIIGGYPSIGYDTLYKDVTASFDAYEHVCGTSIFLKGSTPNVKTVGIYANAQVAAAGHEAFGSNFGTYVTANGVGVACEIDSHNVSPTGQAYALLLDSIGSYPSEAAIVIQNNMAESPFKVGISFNNAFGTGTITQTGIAIGMNAGQCGHFIKANDATFLESEIWLPSLLVGPTVPSANSYLRIQASTSGLPALSALSSAANASVVIRGKGTGGVQLRNENNDTLINVSHTGIGFFGYSPITKPNVTGSKGGNAALDSLCQALANLGLISNLTT